MIINYIKLTDLAENWINGNHSYVRNKVKRLNKVEFLLLCIDIKNIKDSQDLDQIAFSLTY